MRAVEQARTVLELISQVGEIVEAIREFAGQSNLLAVNARVEAAKAGEHGRGFAVVASEIRSLAEQSKESAQRIWKAVNRAEEGRRSLDDAANRMRDLLTALGASVDNARQIAATVGQQSAGITQISEAMTSVAEGGRASAAATEQVERAVTSLTGVARQLQTYVTGTQR
jgi:methyl-accepting chemotaxis protein